VFALKERGVIGEVVRLIEGLDDHVQGLLERLMALLQRDAKADELMRLVAMTEP
jgi:hypothetical protein